MFHLLTDTRPLGSNDRKMEVQVAVNPIQIRWIFRDVGGIFSKRRLFSLGRNFYPYWYICLKGIILGPFNWQVPWAFVIYVFMACIFSAHLHSNEMKFTSNPGRVCFVVMMEVREFDWEPRASVPSRPSYDTFLGTTVPNTIPKKGIYISAPKEPKKNDFTRENLISYKPQKKITWPRFSNVSHCSARLWQRICISVNSSKPMSQSTRHSAISSTCCRGGKVGFVVRWVDMILANCIQKHTRDTNKKNTQKQHMFKQKKRPSKNPSTSLPPTPNSPQSIFFPKVHHLFSLRLVLCQLCILDGLLCYMLSLHCRQLFPQGFSPKALPSLLGLRTPCLGSLT